MLTKLRKQQKGFTIVEVLIVLAIAALILLIVFLAVPALQRNSRNTQRRDDIAKTLGIVSEFSSNNNGVLPGWAACTLGQIVLRQSAGATATQATVEGNYYGKATGTSCTLVTSVPASNTTTVDSFQIVTGATCGANGDPAAGTARQVVALYTLEVGTKQCQST